MKKVYLQPSIYLHTLKIESQILAVTIKGSASEDHWGEQTSENPTGDKEGTPTIGGTGDDNGFILGAPTNKRTY